MKKDVLELARKRGLLVEKDVLEILDKFDNLNLADNFLEGLSKISSSRIITSSSLVNNVNYVRELVSHLPGETRDFVEKVFVKMGFHFEIKREIERKDNLSYRVFYSDTNSKKVEVKDFVGHFRARYQEIQKILMNRTELQNLVSINKISGNRQFLSFIGIVSEKRKTANGNLIIRFEDLTGEINALIKSESECFEKANELQFDDVVAVKASGDRSMVFVHDIIYPDSFKEKISFDEECCVAFVSDIHVGSKKHLGREFEKFVDWINGNSELSKKIKYVFFVGDNVDGVGIFPGQESTLSLSSLKEQYELLASYLKRFPKDVTLFMCPGQHDSVRVAEPQPIIDNYYGRVLYDVSNLILVPNPTMVKLTEGEKEFKILMYHGASIHSLINEIDELRKIKAHSCPARAVRHMLKRRHLAPSHSSVVYIPNSEKDPLVISEIPDILCTGEVHRVDIDNYNGTLIMTGSCWQSQTDFEEKIGNIPDPCKVPVFNLKTRELKILDFSDGKEEGK